MEASLENELTRCEDRASIPVNAPEYRPRLSSGLLTEIRRISGSGAIFRSMPGRDTIRKAGSAEKVIVIVWHIPINAGSRIGDARIARKADAAKEAPVSETAIGKIPPETAMTETSAGQPAGRAAAARSYSREAAREAAASNAGGGHTTAAKASVAAKPMSAKPSMSATMTAANKSKRAGGL
jgi:hypothetical protein